MASTLPSSATGPLAFLYRHPWIEGHLLEAVFGAPLDTLLVGAGERVRKVTLPGVGTCLAAGASPEELVNFWRWRMVRNFALQVLGAEALRAGLSPGPAADGEFPAANLWWRVWADLGSLAPEALHPICHPPAARGEGVRDVLLTTSTERVPLLVAQVERAWQGTAEVSVHALGSSLTQVAHPHRRGGQAWQGYSLAELREFLCQREKPPRQTPRTTAWRTARLERQASTFSREDWDTLVFIGNNPLLTERELSLLFALAHRERVARLTQLGLVGQRKEDGAERLLLTSPGLHLLARFWGCELADLQRRQPWPLRANASGHLGYTTRWARRLSEHTRLTRQFVLSLQTGARLQSGRTRGVTVELLTLIGARFLYVEQAATGWVAPDALLRVRFWQKEDPKSICGFTVLVEIDRATNPLTRLEARLDHYARLWGGLKGMERPCLVWVIVGAEARETAILEKMRARALPGWTVTLDRLRPEGGAGWSARLAEGSLGGMAPFRPVWRSTEENQAGPFLGVGPASREKGARDDGS